METIAYLEFRKLLDVFPFSSGAKPLFQHNVLVQHPVRIGNLDNLLTVFPFSDHANFSDFTLLFCSDGWEMKRVLKRTR